MSEEIVKKKRVKIKVLHYSEAIILRYIKNGFPEDKKVYKYTYEIFLLKAAIKHGNIFDYSKVKEEDIVNSNSRITVICKKCLYEWQPKVNTHVRIGSGCPSCLGYARWDLARFIKRAKEIHENKYDYNFIKEEDIEKNKKSNLTKIKLRCNICCCEWITTITDHINGKKGCSFCSGNLAWTLKNFLKRAEEIHKNKYNYSKIREKDIKGAKTLFKIYCNDCKSEWTTSINCHINNKSGCPDCKTSKGETLCANFLENNNIGYIREFRLEDLPRKRFDFKFCYQGRNVLLEFDGEQHFIFSKHFHKTDESYLKRQNDDIIKTKLGMKRGYFIIRIDYKNITAIIEHINKALEIIRCGKESHYFSNPDLYSYIIDKL